MDCSHWAVSGCTGLLLRWGGAPGGLSAVSAARWPDIAFLPGRVEAYWTGSGYSTALGSRSCLPEGLYFGENGTNSLFHWSLERYSRYSRDWGEWDSFSVFIRGPVGPSPSGS